MPQRAYWKDMSPEEIRAYWRRFGLRLTFWTWVAVSVLILASIFR